MKVTLVQPPSNRFDTSELAPPLGLLSIGAVLRDDNVDVTIVDLNLEGLQDRSRMGPHFYGWATRRIEETAPDIVGFTSMALESHVCLDIARRLKARDPGVRTVLGGPHFSAVAEAMLTLYPWIDFVVTGEGELAMLGLVQALRQGRPPTAVPNVAYINSGSLRLDRLLKPIHGLDGIPFPAYDLVDLPAYFELNPYRVLDVENARGCALRCAFCYSPVHWGQGEQVRSIDRVLEDVHRHHALGARHLFFVGDNFLNSKSYAKGVADAIAGANPGITWRCYSTLPQLTEDVAESLARSQCKYLFIGVDAVSERSKQRYGKRYFRGWPALRNTLDRCLDRGMTPTCAFMVAPPSSDQARDDNEAALAMAARVYNLGAGVRLNPLTVYPQTGIAPTTLKHPVRYSNAKPQILLDGHWVTEHNPYAQERPELYPYHSTVGPAEDYAAFIESTHAGFTLLDHFPRTLMQAVHSGVSLWSLLSRTARRVRYENDNRPTWRNQEAAAFADVVAERGAPPRMRETIKFETTEYQLRMGLPGARVNVELAGTMLECELKPHAQLSLSRSPCDYETTEPVDSGDSPEGRSYLLVRRGSGVRYLEPSASVNRLLGRLQQGAIDGRTVPAPAEGIATLVAADLLALPSHANPGQREGAQP